eukprot:scaffold872_cov421-Prasinococcus_capsulatus_cf.AAC.7
MRISWAGRRRVRQGVAEDERGAPASPFECRAVPLLLICPHSGPCRDCTPPRSSRRRGLSVGCCCERGRARSQQAYTARQNSGGSSIRIRFEIRAILSTGVRAGPPCAPIKPATITNKCTHSTASVSVAPMARVGWQLHALSRIGWDPLFVSR